MALQKIVDSMRTTTALDATKLTGTVTPAADTVTGAKIADNALDSEHYTDGSIDAAHLSANSVDSDAYVDGSIDEAHIANDAVNFATHLKAGTDGELITWDASGNPAAVAVGTATHVLTSGGAGVAPTFQAAAAGGAWSYVSTQAISSDSTVDFTNQVIGYDYHYVLEQVVITNDQANIYIRFGVAGVTYRTSGYFGTGANINNSGTSQSGEATAYIPTTTPQTQELGSQANEGWKYGYVTVNNPMGTTNHTCALGSVVYYSQTPQLCWLNFGGFYETSKEAHVATRFYISAGTMTSGSIFQYRRQRS